jgi:4-hydroxy-3-polyprenylbenzoate decarboxylase
MEHARGIWDELGLPPILPQAPWHGYSLGDWDEHYDVYARRAVEGRWAESGEETLKRRRGGLIPETPARDVASTKKS